MRALDTGFSNCDRFSVLERVDETVGIGERRKWNFNRLHGERWRVECNLCLSPYGQPCLAVLCPRPMFDMLGKLHGVSLAGALGTVAFNLLIWFVGDSSRRLGGGFLCGVRWSMVGRLGVICLSDIVDDSVVNGWKFYRNLFWDFLNLKLLSLSHNLCLYEILDSGSIVRSIDCLFDNLVE